MKKIITDPITENRENVTKLFHEILHVVDINDVKIIEKLEGEDRRNFARFCHELFHNQFFHLIIENFVHAQVMLTAERDWTSVGYDNGKFIVSGAYMVRELIQKFSNIYDTEFKPATDNFDAYKSFEPLKERYLNN